LVDVTDVAIEEILKSCVFTAHISVAERCVGCFAMARGGVLGLKPLNAHR